MMHTITIELFGMARQRAGHASVTLHAQTSAEALRELQNRFTGLQGLLLPAGTLSPHYLLSVNGERFVHNLDEELVDGMRLVLLSADAGG